MTFLRWIMETDIFFQEDAVVFETNSENENVSASEFKKNCLKLLKCNED